MIIKKELDYDTLVSLNAYCIAPGEDIHNYFDDEVIEELTDFSKDLCWNIPIIWDKIKDLVSDKKSIKLIEDECVFAANVTNKTGIIKGDVIGLVDLHSYISYINIIDGDKGTNKKYKVGVLQIPNINTDIYLLYDIF